MSAERHFYNIFHKQDLASRYELAELLNNPLMQLYFDQLEAHCRARIAKLEKPSELTHENLSAFHQTYAEWQNDLETVLELKLMVTNTLETLQNSREQ